MSKFGHADDERQRGALADAGDAQHQRKPVGKVVVAAKMLDNVSDLRRASCLQSGNVAGDHAPQPGLIDMFESGLEARDVLLDLFEKGQISGQFRQSRIGRDLRLLERRCACRDQHRIEIIILGAAQMYPTKRLDLHRLQHQHDEACRAQVLHYAAFVPARRLDADATDASLGQVGRQHAPARQSVGDLPAFGSPVNRDVEFEL